MVPFRHSRKPPIWRFPPEGGQKPRTTCQASYQCELQNTLPNNPMSNTCDVPLVSPSNSKKTTIHASGSRSARRLQRCQLSFNSWRIGCEVGTRACPKQMAPQRSPPETSQHKAAELEKVMVETAKGKLKTKRGNQPEMAFSPVGLLCSSLCCGVAGQEAVVPLQEQQVQNWRNIKRKSH